jgi:hypothetical protein
VTVEVFPGSATCIDDALTVISDKAEGTPTVNENELLVAVG